MTSPCLTCGACCSHFRVSFYWRETDPDSTPNAVPRELTEDLTANYVCMKGTNQKTPRCAALEGKVGEKSICSIYANRSSACREFNASYEDGTTRDVRCEQARAKHGLKPLSPSDWGHQGS